MYGLLKGLEDKRPQRRGSASPFHLARTVFWSFFGVRRMQDLDNDASSLTPLQAICGGFIGTAILILCLLFLVRHITA